MRPVLQAPVPEGSVTETLTAWSEAELEVVLLGVMEGGGRRWEYGVVALGGRGDWGTRPFVLAALFLRGGGPAVEEEGAPREGDDDCWYVFAAELVGRIVDVEG